MCYYIYEMKVFERQQYFLKDILLLDFIELCLYNILVDIYCYIGHVAWENTQQNINSYRIVAL